MLGFLCRTSLHVPGMRFFKIHVEGKHAMFLFLDEVASVYSCFKQLLLFCFVFYFEKILFWVFGMNHLISHELKLLFLF